MRFWGVVPAPRDAAGAEVVGVGEISLDRRIAVDALPTPGAKQAARADARLAGGQIATAMLACARLGRSAAFVGAVGDDADAERALAPLRAGGVDVGDVQRVAGGRTRAALVLVETARGERAVVEQRDPATRLDPARIPLAHAEAARAVLVDATDPPAAHAVAQAARAAGVPVFLDADSPSRESFAIAAEVDFPVVSERFAVEIGRGISVSEGLRALIGAGARVAVATLGERGALARTADGRELGSGAFEIAPVDTTGAGDAFHAAWIDAALDGLDLAAALRRANGAAALACLAVGAQGALASRETLEAFLRDARQRRWRSDAA
ncbi:MAG: PfkB family carbohydrate kinase [Myxococcota bacterium]